LQQLLSKLCLCFCRKFAAAVSCATVQVFSRAALAAAWAQQPLFLKQQLALWVKQQQRHALDRLWPQLLQQAAAAAAGSGGPSAAVAGSKSAAAAGGSAGRSAAAGKKRKKSKLV
jgi:hypothetical protein